jgi:PAS domain S-box-containing protein
VTKNRIAFDSQRLEGIVASAMDAIITINEAQEVVLFNPAAERMFKCSAAEGLGQPIDRFIPERFRASHHRHIRRFGGAGTTNRRMGSLGSISGVRADGEEFPIEASISQVQIGPDRLFTVILRDVTERQAGEAALMESRRRLEGIVESAMDAIITVDEAQKIVLFNPAAERMFGCSADEAVGQSISRFIPERFRAGHDEHIRRFHQAGVTTRRMGALGAISGLRASGEEFPIEASISQITIGGERLSTVILRDIGERKASEESRLLLAREVDHRAKNALAVAQALVSLTKAESAEAFGEAVKGRIAALARAHSLLSQSRWRGAPLRQIALDELSPYASESQILLDGPPVTITADSVQPLSLIFHELATNAVKHGAFSREEGSVRLSWRTDAERLKIEWIERDGPAVRAPSNTGFGSKLLGQVADRQLEAELAFDWHRDGLRFTAWLQPGAFKLERTEREAERTHAPAEGVAARLPRREAVLVVEDEELLALEISTELTRLGWAVVGPAATLKEAEALLEGNAGLAAAVLDVNLRGRPVYPLAESLARRGIPFVFCTGYEMVDPEGRFPDAPIIKKPASAKAVSVALRALL